MNVRSGALALSLILLAVASASPAAHAQYFRCEDYAESVERVPCYYDRAAAAAASQWYANPYRVYHPYRRAKLHKSHVQRRPNNG